MPLPPTPPQSVPLPTSKSVALAQATELDPHEKEMLRKATLLSKVRMVREFLASNQGMVEGMKPDKIYVWVHISDNRQIHYQSMGYELCTDPEIKSKWKRSDGTHKRGDVILYQIDKDLHEAIDMEAQLRAIEAVEGAREGFKAFAERQGVPVYEPGKK
jgi:hypothetical protein